VKLHFLAYAWACFANLYTSFPSLYVKLHFLVYTWACFASPYTSFPSLYVKLHFLACAWACFASLYTSFPSLYVKLHFLAYAWACFASLYTSFPSLCGRQGCCSFLDGVAVISHDIIIFYNIINSSLTSVCPFNRDIDCILITKSSLQWLKLTKPMCLTDFYVCILTNQQEKVVETIWFSLLWTLHWSLPILFRLSLVTWRKRSPHHWSVSHKCHWEQINKLSMVQDPLLRLSRRRSVHQRRQEWTVAPPPPTLRSSRGSLARQSKDLKSPPPLEPVLRHYRCVSR